MNNESLTSQTIHDFGEQWIQFKKNEGYYGSQGLLKDLLHPFLTPDDIKDKQVADIGSGTGRIVKMLLDAGASHVTGIEPSKAFQVMQQQNFPASRVTLLQGKGEILPPIAVLDYVFSIGVLHHIPDPIPVVQAAYRALKPGGRFVVWLYGQEGNEIYLSVAPVLRGFTKKMPDRWLIFLSWMLAVPLTLYIGLCRYIKLPMRTYMRDHLGRLSFHQRVMTIFDQLNPAYAKYYKKQEAIDLIQNAGFVHVQTFNRHGYSWTVIGTKPNARSKAS